MLNRRLPCPGDTQRAFPREIDFEGIGGTDLRKERPPEAITIVGV
jgi:hypothetical protein